MVKNDKSNVVYKKEVASGGDAEAFSSVSLPRNLKQLRNLRFRHSTELRISRDALFNVQEIAYDVPGFVWKITT